MKRDLNYFLFDYVRGDLSEEDSRCVEERRLVDPEFAEELEIARAALRMVSVYRPLESPPLFWTRLSARLYEVEHPWQSWIWVSKRLIPTLVAVTLLVTAVIWYREPAYEASDVNSDSLAWGTQEDWYTQTGEISKDSVLESALFSESTGQE